MPLKLNQLAASLLALALLPTPLLPTHAMAQEMSAGIGPAVALQGTPLEVALAPNGRMLAWVESSNSGARIFVAPLHNLSHKLAITALSNTSNKPCNENAIAWAHDSESLAFLSDCTSPAQSPALYLGHLFAAAPPQRLTQIEGNAGALRFSDDDALLALLVQNHQHQQLQTLALGLSHALLTPAPTGAQTDALDFDWQPGSHQLLVLSRNPNGSSLLAYEAASPHATATLLLEGNKTAPLAQLEIVQAAWSPDAKKIALLAGSPSQRASLWLFTPDTGQLLSVNAGRPTSSVWLQWEDNTHLFVSERAGGNVQLLRYRLPQKNGEEASFGAPVFSIPGEVDNGTSCMALSSPASHALFVFRATTATRPVALYAAKPSVVMSGGIEGLLQLTLAPTQALNVTPLCDKKLWQNLSEAWSPWRCANAFSKRRHLINSDN